MTRSDLGAIEVYLFDAGAGVLLERWRPGLHDWQSHGWTVRIRATPLALAHLPQGDTRDVRPMESPPDSALAGPVIVLSDRVFAHPLAARSLCFSAALRRPLGDWAPAWAGGLPDRRMTGVSAALSEMHRYLDGQHWTADGLAERFRQKAITRGFGIYGRGMVGRAAMRAAARHGLQASFWVDSGDPGPAAVQDGLPVHTPRTAPDAPVIVAAGAAEEMVATWERAGRGDVHGLSLLHLACGMPDQPESSWRQDALQRRGAWLWLLGQMDGPESLRVLSGLLRFRRSLDDCALWAVRSASEQWFDADYFDAASMRSMVDCGAYDGDTARAFFARVPDGRVVCIEPDASLAARARRDVAMDAGRCDVVRAAIGSHSGTAVFLSADGMSGAVVPDAAGGERVPVTTVDSWLDARAAMVKIDVEGQESQALAGAARTVHNGAMVAVAAYHKAGDLVDLADVLVEMRETALGVRHYTGLAFETVLYTTRQAPLAASAVHEAFNRLPAAGGGA